MVGAQRLQRIEHRLFRREPVHRTVTLHQFERCLGFGCVRNASRHGLLIHCDAGSTPSGIIDIELPEDGTRVRGCIVHRFGACVGVMLLDEWPIDRARLASA